MLGKNKIQFFKDWLRQNTGINLDALTVNITLKVMLVEWANNNKINNEEKLGVSWEDKYQVKSIDMGSANAMS